MKKLAIHLTLFLTLACSLFACLEELDDVDKIGGAAFEPIFEFPLINSDFTFRDFLVEGKSKARIVEQNGVMTLIYDDSVSTPTAESFFSVTDQSTPGITFNGGEFALPPGSSVTINKSQTFNFNTQGEALDSIWLKSGSLLFSFQSSFQANIDLKITIESLHDNSGIQVIRNFALQGPSSASAIINLTDMVVDLTDGGTTSNTFRFSAAMTITSTGQAVTAAQTLTADLSMSGLAFRALFGDLGTRSFAMKADSINVDIFDNAYGNASFELLNPSIALTIHNSYGLPIGFDVNTVAAIKPPASAILLSGPAVSSPLNPYLIGAPGYSQLGQSVSSTVTFNSANSNLSDLLSSLPEYLEYQFNADLNPNHANTKNFVLDTSRLTIGVHLELPFSGSIGGFTLVRSYDFDGLGIDDVESSVIALHTVNGAPIDVSLQVYFALDDGTLVDSLFQDPHIIKSAQVGSDGFATMSTSFSTQVSLQQQRVDRINQATKIILAASMATTNNGTTPVKFSANDEFQVAVGVKTKMKYNLD